MFYGTMAGTVGWSKVMVANQVQVLLGSGRNFSQPCWEPQLIENSWPGTRVKWMQFMGFRSLTTLWWVSSTYLPPFRFCICALILDCGGVPTDAKTRLPSECHAHRNLFCYGTAFLVHISTHTQRNQSRWSGHGQTDLLVSNVCLLLGRLCDYPP